MASTWHGQREIVACQSTGIGVYIFISTQKFKLSMSKLQSHRIFVENLQCWSWKGWVPWYAICFVNKTEHSSLKTDNFLAWHGGVPMTSDPSIFYKIATTRKFNIKQYVVNFGLFLYFIIEPPVGHLKTLWITHCNASMLENINAREENDDYVFGVQDSLEANFKVSKARRKENPECLKS